ncbi:MAG TPA: lysophospholipid acyltransferase family protein [Candidatus Nanopelagicales bacterium]|nr:lysophospholipid acyltransferase family protein [Candidatus Nanopelagicales bacterium]
MREEWGVVVAVRSGKRLGGWYHLAVGLLRPGMMAVTRRDWRGAQHLRAEVRADGSQEGIVVCTNHISWFDPLECAHFLYDNGRPPRFLGKEAVFRVPVAGRIIKGAGQIPVYRETVDAAASVREAIAAVERGECVVVYPEGTISRDPGLWPMTGKTGAARIALATGAAVIPVAQWGAQDVIGPYKTEFKAFPRKTMHVWAGPPVDLDDLRGRPLDTAVLAEATARIMAAITAILEEIRGEKAPVERYDLRKNRAAQPGSTDGEVS